MSNIDLVKTGHAAWSSGQWDTLASLLTDDFEFTGAVPQPLGKDAFIGLGKALITAVPDWDFHAHDFQESGDQVSCVDGITGTQTGVLAAIPGVPPVAPTGKSINLASSTQRYTMRGNQVSRLDIQGGGGVPELYAQVGAPLPTP